MKNKSFHFPVSSSNGKPPFKRFEQLSNGFSTRTVVRIKKGANGFTVTISNVKWSRYRVVNLLKKLFIIIKYSI